MAARMRSREFMLQGMNNGGRTMGKGERTASKGEIDAEMGSGFDVGSMRHVLVFFTFLLLAFNGLAASAEDAALAEFYRQYLDRWLEERPLAATQLGDHRFDHRLEDVSEPGRERFTELLRHTLEQLPRQVRAEALSDEGRIDYAILEHDLKRSLWLEENTDPWAEDPRIYNGLITDSVYLLLTQSSRPLDSNVVNALARMRQIPSLLDVAKANLNRPPRVHTETAVGQVRGAIRFYEQQLGDLAKGSVHHDELVSAGRELAESLREYQRFLEGTLLAHADGEWRLGPAKFAQKLELTLNAGMSAEAVLAEAQKEYERVRAEMYVIARQLWSRYYGGRPLPSDDLAGRQQTMAWVLEAIGRDHGEARHLTRDVKRIVGGLRTFIAERDILRLPAPDQCAVIEMPEFQRGNSTAYLNSAPPLDPNAGSYYAVSPPPLDWSSERVESYLQEYNRNMLHILSIHEAYPGHYVQLEYANRHPSLIRRVVGSGTFVEGWAVYSEQMMLDQGYGEGDLPLRLTQLKFYLRAVINAILDHRMHCTELSDEEAMALLVNGGFQSEGEARLKVIRTKQSSGQLSTYFVGRTAVHRLRQEIQRECGDAFELGRFHEAVLAHGSLPPRFLSDLVRARLRLPR
jgi:uncharacterized protein (DUF885 family)